MTAATTTRSFVERLAASVDAISDALTFFFPAGDFFQIPIKLIVQRLHRVAKNKRLIFCSVQNC